MNSLQGHLLIASPYLVDPNFVRSVVLIIQHNENGAFGVILNRLHPKRVRDLWREVSETPCESDRFLNIGGPVSGPLMALHDDPLVAEMEIIPGVYFSLQRQNIEHLMANKDRQARVFVGHSGWAAGQLEGELEQGSWLVAPATRDLVFTDDERNLWQTVAFAVGRAFLANILRPKHRPEQPYLN